MGIREPPAGYGGTGGFGSASADRGLAAYVAVTFAYWGASRSQMARCACWCFCTFTGSVIHRCNWPVCTVRIGRHRDQPERGMDCRAVWSELDTLCRIEPANRGLTCTHSIRYGLGYRDVSGRCDGRSRSVSCGKVSFENERQISRETYGFACS